MKVNTGGAKRGIQIKAKRHIGAITMYATFKRIKTGRAV
jgi:hypothetical protein